jgi:hypothetical protein
MGDEAHMAQDEQDNAAPDGVGAAGTEPKSSAPLETASGVAAAIDPPAPSPHVADLWNTFLIRHLDMTSSRRTGSR